MRPKTRKKSDIDLYYHNTFEKICIKDASITMEVIDITFFLITKLFIKLQIS